MVVFGLMVFVSVHQPSLSAQSVTGTTGLYSIPSARVMADRTFSTGFYFYPAALTSYSRNGRYNNANYHATLMFLPRLEVMFRYTRMLSMTAEERESLFMDRMITVRVQLLKEQEIWPSLLMGFQDFGGTFGTTINSYFGANYLVASKTFERAGFYTDITLGYAFDLKKDPSIVMSGLFGGFELKHSKHASFSLLTEYDSTRLNTALKADFKYLVLLAGLMDLKYFSGGISCRIYL